MIINSNINSFSKYPIQKQSSFKGYQQDTITLTNPSYKEYDQFEHNGIEKRIAQILNFFGHRSNGDAYTDLDNLLEIANTDGPTGLKNKRALITDLEKTAAGLKTQTGNHKLTLAMFDMDNFKAVNELLGYDIGDSFIQIIGHEIKTIADKYERDAYRFGGEEFYILMPDTDIETAIKIADEARITLNENKEIDSYMWRAIFEGKRKIKELEKEQAPFTEYKKALDKYNILKEQNEVFGNNLQSQLEEANCEVLQRLQKLLLMAYSKAANEEDKSLIASRLKKLSPLEDANKYCDKTLMTYLNVHYNNEAKIAQITRWIEELQKPVNVVQQGFTITCGVKEFSDLDLSAQEYIKQTGDVLAKGKSINKGHVYT